MVNVDSYLKYKIHRAAEDIQYLLHKKAAVHVTTNVLSQWLQIKQIQSITGQKYTLFTNIFRKEAKRLRCFSFSGNVFFYIK